MKRQLFTQGVDLRSRRQRDGPGQLFHSPGNRISEHPEIYQSLSPRDQALVRRGQIRTGMSTTAVWLAWGAPDQKTEGAMRGRATETWIYTTTTTAYGAGYRPYYGGTVTAPALVMARALATVRFWSESASFRTHHHGRFVIFGDPFYDPFFYSSSPDRVSIPTKIVTFFERTWSYHYLIPPAAHLTVNLKNGSRFQSLAIQCSHTRYRWLIVLFDNSSTRSSRRAS